MITKEQIKWRDIDRGEPDQDIPGDDIMTINDFIKTCKEGWCIDYDGFGAFVTRNQVSNVIVYPSEVISENFKKPDWATHICWYNR